MSAPGEALRKILALERTKKFRDDAAVGGLDSALLRFARHTNLPTSHPLSHVLQSLPPGGYRALHRIQRERVVDELEKTLGNGDEFVAVAPSPRMDPEAPKPAPVPKPKLAAKTSATSVAPPPPSPPRVTVGTLDSPVSVLGIRRADGEKFRKIGVESVRDLLFHFPRRYHDYSEARPIWQLQIGEEQTVVGTVWTAGEKQMGRQRRRATEVVITDGSGRLRVVWWNQPWVAKRFFPGMKVALSGKVGEFKGQLQMDAPEIEALDEDALGRRRLIPVYQSTERLQQTMIRDAVRMALDVFADKLDDALPESVRKRHELGPASEAIRQVHFPESPEHAEAARDRFGFEELLYIELGVVRRRREWQAIGGAPRLTMEPQAMRDFFASLPFELTGSQSFAIDEILKDLSDDIPMTRLLEGDVGSGKTVVAAAALMAGVASGFQGAIMAPTEILAEQHFRTFTRILDPNPREASPDGPWFQAGAPGYVAVEPPYMSYPVKVALLTGSLKTAEKTAVQDAIASGEVDIAIGTHALLQQGVSFARLGLVVVDEQHRFGVDQRAALREKGGSPHVLVMTATPIPRTLALTVYGDLDITLLRDMPPGRPKVKTYRVLPYRRDEAFDLARKRIAEGRQAYIICPLVEESEAIEAKAAVTEFERLSRDVFPDLRLGLLHGRMSSKDKEAVMRSFRDHEIDILVSTAVVEVGVDVPNATVMLIEGAERFGLSQLHQFRGRVRRSEKQGYCFLLSDNPSPESEERLVIMETVDDGFELAEEDLRLRGPGEYFGRRQSGMPDLRVAKLTDIEMIENARREAGRLLDDDPQLEKPEHAVMRERVAELWDRLTAEAS